MSSKTLEKTGPPLTDKQRLFCTEYLKDGNGTQAARRAGYSLKTCNEQAARLLAKNSVRTLIESMQSKSINKVLVSREKVLAQYAKLAFFDPRKFYDPVTGQLKRVIDLDEDSAAALTGVEVDEQTTLEDDENDIIGDKPIVTKTTATKKIKFTDMKAALDSICRMEGYNMPDKMLSFGKIETVVRYERDTDNHNKTEEAT